MDKLKLPLLFILHNFPGYKLVTTTFVTEKAKQKEVQFSPNHNKSHQGVFNNNNNNIPRRAVQSLAVAMPRALYMTSDPSQLCRVLWFNFPKSDSSVGLPPSESKPHSTQHCMGVLQSLLLGFDGSYDRAAATHQSVIWWVPIQ